MTNLLTLSGPASLELLVDKGPSGERGNNIFLSRGNPNVSANLSASPILGDLCIDIDTASVTYLFLYYYESPGLWSPKLRLIPNSASKIENAVFVNGQSSINVNVALPPGSPVSGDIAERLDIQYSIANDTALSTQVQNPMSSSFYVASISVTNSIVTLALVFSAVELLNTSWVPLQGQKSIHLVITVV